MTEFEHEITNAYNSALEIVQNEYPEINFDHWKISNNEIVTYDSDIESIIFTTGNIWNLNSADNIEGAQELYDELTNHFDFDDPHKPLDHQFFDMKNNDKFSIDYCDCGAMRLQVWEDNNSTVTLDWGEISVEEDIANWFEENYLIPGFTQKQTRVIVMKKASLSMNSTERSLLSQVRNKINSIDEKRNELDQIEESIEQFKLYNLL